MGDSISSMSDATGRKVDRRVLRIDSLHEPSDDKAYWLSRSPEERLQAVETMRQIIYGYDPAAVRLQRILEIIACPPR
jgi:hypothetical protein